MENEQIYIYIYIYIYIKFMYDLAIDDKNVIVVCRRHS